MCHFWVKSWSGCSQQTFFVFQDVLKTSSRRLQDVFEIRLPKRSSRRLQDVFKTFSRRPPRRLQDVFKTCLLDVLQLCLQDVFKTSWKTKNVTLKTSSRSLQDVFSTSSPRRMFAGLISSDEILQTNQWVITFHISTRSSRPEMFLRKGVLKVCSKFIGEHPCRRVFPIKLDELWAQLCYFFALQTRKGKDTLWNFSFKTFHEIQFQGHFVKHEILSWNTLTLVSNNQRVFLTNKKIVFAEKRHRVKFDRKDIV